MFHLVDLTNMIMHDLSIHDYPFIMVDATYFKVRENHRVVSKALFIAVGLTTDGKKEVLYFNVYDGENNDTWLDFFSHLKANGLKDPLMLTSDAHKSIRYAAFKVFPSTPWQRCQFHFTKNILDAAPKSQRPGLEVELKQIFLARSLTEARKKRDDILSDYSDIAPKAMELLDNGFEDAKEVYRICGEKLGGLLSVLIDILNPDTIVIGSIFQRSENLIRTAMENKIRKECLYLSRDICKIVPAELKENLGDYAAIAVAAM